MEWQYRIGSDYLEKYLTDEGFDIVRLFDDDFLKAIKLLLNNHHYISGLKLIFSMIDSIAYLEFGDSRRNFIDWLDTYADLAGLEVTSDELWECRNALLHMTGLESRKIRQGNVRKLIPMVGGEIPEFLKNIEPGTGYLNIHQLYLLIVHSFPDWIQTYNENPDKWATFIDRYDEISSESRLSFLESL